ncbi:MAG: ATPase [Spirochaetae bacterium HGW-Spirochaetae-4]|nr:MAG: ATPase [Spirochaetae bacterium HGW-Spirochaetae-4]
MDRTVANAHTKTEQDVIGLLATDPKNGLSQQEAARRLAEFGPNAIAGGAGVSAWKILLHNLNNIIVYLLIVAAAVAFAMGDTVEGIAIIIAILIAVLSGFISEYKAQKSVESLQNLVKTIAKVVRDGTVRQVESTALVVGDLLFIEEGDSVTIDGRIIQTSNFACNESALTGESEAVEKDDAVLQGQKISIGDRKNMVHAGTAATRGNAYAIATSAGMDTELGRISSMLDQEKKSSTPLEQQLDKLGKTLIVISAVVALIVTVMGVLAGEQLYAMIKIGIILAIAAVPEALPAVSTITLALGMRTMASHNALVKNLPAVETLGSTTVICTDKTGTLTENQMTVTKVHVVSEAAYEVEGTGYSPVGNILSGDKEVLLDEHEDLAKLIHAGVLCSNATLVEEDGYSVIGDPTEGALVVLGRKASIDRKSLEAHGFTRIGELPFNSRDKYMVTAYTDKSGSNRLYIKGASDILIGLSKSPDAVSRSLTGANDALADQGLRVLAIGEIDDYEGDGSEQSIREAMESGFTLLGLVGIIDPPREDVKQAVREAREAGIRVIMITGDHPKTAKIIAGRIGMDQSGEVITGAMMDDMSTEELAEKILVTSIFARVSPENKLQIVHALNADHEVTAMTGDGVNDAPALNGADIGIAMGIRGTEVAKEASDMILTDDRFSTIVDAVREGRVIFDNIEKFIYFLFSCNFIEIMVIFAAIVLRVPMPILALQILWLNLVVDVLPAMSLAWEPGEPGVMKRKPRDPQKAIVTRSFLIKVLGNGALIGLGTFAAFVISLWSGMDETIARTIAFSTLAFGQLLHIFNVREKESFGFDRSLLKNPFLLLSLALSAVLQLLVIYLPFFNRVMETAPLNAGHWLFVLAGSCIPLALIQLWRIVGSRRKTV